MNQLTSLNKNSKLSEWLEYINPMQFNKTKDRNLDKVRFIAQKLGLLKPAKNVFLVAGTNGKGSTSKIIENILLKFGYKVGLFINPEVFYYTEQLNINGRELQESDHCYALSCIENAREGIDLTKFEFIFLSILFLLANENLDIAVVEVGMGGLLDPTNILDPDVSIITSVGIEHTNWLGNTRDEIAIVKSGIARQNKPLIFGESDIPNILLEMETKKEITLYSVGRDWDYIELSKKWKWYNQNETIENIPYPKLLLQNAATAIAAIKYSNIAIDSLSICDGIDSVSLLGRFSVVCKNPYIVVDISHNDHGMVYLKKQLMAFKEDNLLQQSRVFAVFGPFAGKNINKMVHIMNDVVAEWFFFEIQSPRKFNVANDKYLGHHAHFKTAKKAMENAFDIATENDIILAFGSLDAARECMSEIRKLI